MSDFPRHVIIGTAGHIDHGKSALVRALTGIDPDTLPEEKARGMTVDLGFVFLPGEVGGTRIVFIDVPGHEGLVRTMVAGTSGIDAALLVVAADEGVMVQTVEHLGILELLGIGRGIVALTKSDLVDRERLAEVCSETGRLVAGSFLEGAPVIPVSARTGAGTGDLRAALESIAARVPPRPGGGPFRLPVDRVFTVRGFGTVVAGTVLSGTVSVGERVELFPEGVSSRVRGLQVDGKPVARVGPGMRAALNLPEIERARLARGQTAAAPGSLSSSNRIDALFRLLAGTSARPLRNRARLRLHAGTREVICRLILLDRDEITPGSEASVQFFLESPLVAAPGDRYIVRTFSPVRTIGGGVVLDGAARRRKRFDGHSPAFPGKAGATVAEAVEQVLAAGRGAALGIDEISRQVGRDGETVLAALESLCRQERAFPLEAAGPGRRRLFIHPAALEAPMNLVVSEIEEYLEKNPYRSAAPLPPVQSRAASLSGKWIAEAAFRRLEGEGLIERRGANVLLCGHRVSLSPEESAAADRIARFFLEAAFSPPVEREASASLGLEPGLFDDLLGVLLDRGVLVRLSDKVIYHHRRLEEMEKLVLGILSRLGRVSVSGLRDELGISRKYTQAVLEHFDAAGLTRREGDDHLPAA